MANWLNPTVLSNYAVFVDEVKARDVDAITLQLNAVTSPPTGAIKLVRSPVKFQEWDGTQFVDRILSIAGGGTGATTLSGLGGAMGLGTMAYQNYGSVSITGGVISNTSLRLACEWQGTTFNFVSTGGGSTCAMFGPSGHWGLHVSGHGADGSGGGGVLINAGTGINDYALLVHNVDYSKAPLIVTHVGTIIRDALVVPVGANKFYPS